MDREEERQVFCDWVDDMFELYKERTIRLEKLEELLEGHRKVRVLRFVPFEDGSCNFEVDTNYGTFTISLNEEDC